MYIIASQIVSTICLIWSIFVMSVFYHQPLTPVPRWLKYLAFNILSPITGNFIIDEKSHTKASPQCENKEKTFEEKKDEGGTEGKRYLVTLPNEIMEIVKSIQIENEKHCELDKNRQEWQTVARIIDRFLSISTLTLVIIAMLSVYLYVRLE